MRQSDWQFDVSPLVAQLQARPGRIAACDSARGNRPFVQRMFHRDPESGIHDHRPAEFLRSDQDDVTAVRILSG